MINIAISYFYQIRFFKPYMIPVSTAIWDPKWFHEYKAQGHTFIDKNGVINGLRIRPLMPCVECEGLCRGRELCKQLNPVNCEFMRVYNKQLDEIDFQSFIQELEVSASKVQSLLKFQETPLVVLIVHEKYDNPCSERIPILNWFHRNGVGVRELQYPVSNFY